MENSQRVVIAVIVVGAFGTFSKNREIWSLEEDFRPSRPEHYKNQLRYLEATYASEETWCYSDSSERNLFRSSVKAHK